MVTSTFDISHDRGTGAARAPRTEGEDLRYRLDVVAASVADVVQSAGGWLYDRVMAGWEVTALLPPGSDSRPLRILGVQSIDGELRPSLSALRCQTLAVSAEAFSAHASVRDRVIQALGDRLTEVALWGDGLPLGVNRATTRTQHVLSSAARRFKGFALAAAGLPCDSVYLTETLLCDMASCSPVDAESAWRR
ncbi:hypothetical protein [Mycobacterium sp. Marseille-P9652]|uniref:hypothetical protein n=1 Tax=Mycobacterium sp. Marseille-P9652 TaxID=2654950 RepID=UPI0012E7B524|nr:hypothetical protein [Mycobacterium sp. Marseille-P9652]